MFKVIFFDETLSLDEKITKIETIGNIFSAIFEKTGDIVFAVVEKSIWCRLANDLTFRGGDDKDIIRIR